LRGKLEHGTRAEGNAAIYCEDNLQREAQRSERACTRGSFTTMNQLESKAIIRSKDERRKQLSWGGQKTQKKRVTK